MFRQIQYFQSVVKNNSFSLAAEECHISQSAISQQIRALEKELGFLLLERKNRKFTLTPAGEHFYKKSLILLADFNQICEETKKIAHADEFALKIGYLRSYSGQEFQSAVEEFSIKHADISVQICLGNHEELYDMLKSGEVDLVLNDQRRAFSDEYINLELITSNLNIEISGANPISELSEVEVSDLKNIPCIVVTSASQQETEEKFYSDIVGIRGGFIFADNLEEARLMVVSGKGYMILEGGSIPKTSGTSLKRITLLRNNRPITQKYCAFWKKDNSGYYVEEFAEVLKKHFQ